MDNPTLIIVLALGTLAIVLAAGIVQLTRVRRSQAKRGETPGGMAGPTRE